MSTNECANLNISCPELRNGKSSIFAVWRNNIETNGSPSSGNLFSIGWNWDEAGALKFIADTYTWGIRLLQSDHFCCSE